MGTHAFVARAEEVHLFLPVHKGNVRHGVHELFRVCNHPAAHGVAPKIFGLLELIENLDRLGHIHFAVIAAIWRVAQLTNTCMASAGVVPTIGTFLRQLGRYLIELNSQVRLQIF